MLCQFGKPSYVMVRRLPNCFVTECSEYFRCFVWCTGLWMYLYINRWKSPFIKTHKYVFTDSFSSPLIITNSFGKLAICQTPFRKNWNKTSRFFFLWKLIWQYATFGKCAWFRQRILLLVSYQIRQISQIPSWSLYIILHWKTEM